MIDLYGNNNRNYNRIVYVENTVIMRKIRLAPQHIVAKLMGYIQYIDSRNLI